MTDVGATAAPDRHRSRVLAAVLGVWALGYAGYRAYYAAGGTFGLIGTPVSAAQFQAINAVGAAIILAAAVLPVLAVRFGPGRRVLPVLGWAGAVGCGLHALVDITLRVLSVTGVHPTQLPASTWLTFDRRAADLQDLLLNEPWFLVEGLLWAALGLTLVGPERKRRWLTSAVVVCLLLSVVGVLSGVGVIAAFHLG